MKWAAAGVFSYCISGLPLQDGMDGVGGADGGGTVGHQAGQEPAREGLQPRSEVRAAGFLARRELLILGFHNKKVTHRVSTYPASSPVGVFEPR